MGDENCGELLRSAQNNYGHHSWAAVGTHPFFAPPAAQLLPKNRAPRSLPSALGQSTAVRRVAPALLIEVFSVHRLLSDPSGPREPSQLLGGF